MSDQNSPVSAQERQRRLQHLETVNDALSDPEEFARLRALLMAYLNPDQKDEAQ